MVASISNAVAAYANAGKIAGPGLAARDGAPAILASSELIEALTEPLPSRTWPSLTLKGRSAPVMVAGLG